ncbi:MAG: FAD-dependent oxidoreductase [Candidatus Omnitrophica bacterium]|nr:FAD-dependent oxidoreductase [Candidatus Omnitrophota bacterium]
MIQPAPRIQIVKKRSKNFQEVSLGYSKKITMEEARRCPQCSEPACREACPLGIDIPGFIRLLREGDALKALEKIQLDSYFAGVCGRICHAPCEASCILFKESAAVGIKQLERFASDHGRKKLSLFKKPHQAGKKIAVIGSGPSGLTAAAFLLKMGYQVTVFESFIYPGGVLFYGVPEFRLPNSVVNQDIASIKDLGADIRLATQFGKNVTLEELKQQDYRAVLLAMGSGGAYFFNIPGAHFGGVYFAEEILIEVNVYTHALIKRILGKKLGQHIAVLGAGQAALDCARVCVRLGKTVSIVHHGTEDEIGLLPDEREFAKEEGVRFEVLANPLEIMGNNDGFVSGLKCVRMDYADPDGKGDWALIPVPDSEFILDVDTIIIAAGHKVNEAVSLLFPKIKKTKRGLLKVDEKSQATSLPEIFAAGDLVEAHKYAVEAMASGKKAALALDGYLKNKV